MFTRKFVIVVLTIAALLAACSYAYAASGEGYFGNEDIEFDDVSEQETDTSPAPVQPRTNSNGQEYRPPVLTYGDSDEEEYEAQPAGKKTPSKASSKTRLENHSDNTEKVLRSYGVEEATFNRMLDRHKDAANGIGNREKVDRYEILFNEYPYDYLAAYRAAQANMAMGRKGQAQTWLERALKINPNYVPAKQLLKKAKAR